MKAEMIPNTKVGIQTEMAGGMAPLSANDRNMITNKIKINDKANPMAI
jgi:hypothetical protein